VEDRDPVVEDRDPVVEDTPLLWKIETLVRG
jgi:hypothetical protein